MKFINEFVINVLVDGIGSRVFDISKKCVKVIVFGQYKCVYFCYNFGFVIFFVVFYWCIYIIDVDIVFGGLSYVIYCYYCFIVL